MSRHFGAARLASGILFSAPADIDAEPDVWTPKRKKKPQRFGRFSMKYDAESQDASSARMMGDEDYSQTQRSSYSVFPQFINTTRTKPSNHQIPTEPSLLSPPSSKRPVTLCLPICKVSVDVSIDGTISHTKLTQSFHNPSEINIAEARHTFPLYYGAVITSFECKIGDSRRLRGVVKPTAQARREFEESKERKREAAALLEEVTPEVFETSLGNIPANTTVEISLTYVHELKVVTSKEEKSEGLAITVPSSIAPQYAASVMPAPSHNVPSDKLDITIRVSDGGTINPVCCHVESNHSSTTYHGLQPSSNVLIANIAELHNLNSAASSIQKLQHVWKYSSESQSALRGDFVFVIQMLEETRLQSHAVITPANDMGHAALMVSLRPNDLFGSAVRPDLFKGEILFVLDRSSSMSWTQAGTYGLKIETMRNAMSLALSGLPFKCRFNIISFGSEVRGMWIKSRKADEAENLSYAREYLTNVKADMAGTKVLLALKGAVNNHEPGCLSTQIILITDGEIDDEPHSSILKYVWETRKKHGEKIRFFTLGIGDSVSHSVLESIAELGGGYCDVVDVVKKPRWEGCLNRMVRSVMEPEAWTCDIDLGPGYKRQSLAASKFGTGDGSDIDFIHYAQGPHLIPSLQPFRYKSFFFLLDLKDAKPPTTVTIRTTSEAAKKKVYSMAVKMAQLREGTMHPLAVKMILRSLEDEVKRTRASEKQARLNAEYLGTKYAILSNWASFIAVGDGCVEQNCQIDTYKSRFREADIEELLVSESEESSEVPWMASNQKGPNSVGHMNALHRYPNFRLLYSRSPSNENGRTRATKRKREEESLDQSSWFYTCGLNSDNQTINSLSSNAKLPFPMCRESTHHDMINNLLSNAETDKDAPGELIDKGVNNGNRSEAHKSDITNMSYHLDTPLQDIIEVSLNESMLEIKEKKIHQTTPASCNEKIDGDDDKETDQSHYFPGSNNAAALSRSPTTQDITPYIQDDDGDLPCRLMVINNNNIYHHNDNNSEHSSFTSLIETRVTGEQTSFIPLDAKLLSDIQDCGSCEILNAISLPNFGTCAEIALRHEDVLFYQPSGDGPIAWQDAAGCENGGMFILPVVVRERLRQHFCGMTVEHLQTTLRDSSGAKVAKEEEAVLIDTLMMMQYFKTHLAAEQDYWSLLMDKAERALLLALGYDEDQDEALEPLYETLLSAILHVHFPESLKHASVYQEEDDKSPDSSKVETCLVCNIPIETDCEKQPIINKGYTCLADECYDNKAQCRKTYTNWKMFWDHQVQSGHLLCPEINEGNEDTEVNAEAHH